MDTSVHAYIDQIEQKSLSSSEDKNSVVAESDRNTHEVAISQEDFDAWFDYPRVANMLLDLSH